MHLVDLPKLDDFLAQERKRNARLAVGANVAEVYLLWYCFLRLSPEYEQCCRAGGEGDFKQFYDDWGDVFHLDFPSWWEKRGRLVSGADSREIVEGRSVQVVRPIVEEIKTDEQLRLHDVNDETVMLVAVHVTASLEEVKDEIARLFLKKTGRSAGTKITPQLAKEIAPYPTKNVDLKFLRNVYECYAKWIDLGKPNYPHLAKQLKPHWGKQLKPKAADARQVGRWIRQGESIVRHAPLGVFPQYEGEGTTKASSAESEPQ